MISTDLLALAPLIVLSLAAVIVMVATPLGRSHRLIFTLTLVGLGAALASIRWAAPLAPRQVTPLLVVDVYSLFFTGLIIVAAAAVALFSYGYNRVRPIKRCEYYILLLLATAGAAVLTSSSHFASFFLGIELLSVSLYGLIAYQRLQLPGIEAAIKYLVLAGVSSALLLFGMALVYADIGTMEFSQIAAYVAQAEPISSWSSVGLTLILVGIGFKLAVVPMHLWTADVYEGAPAPVTAFIATVSKAAVFALAIRYFMPLDVRNHAELLAAITAIAIASMLTGNLLALRQQNLKRLLAYSSVAHLGYLLVALIASGPDTGAGATAGIATTDGGTLAATAVTFYLVAYVITTLGAFGVITVLSAKDPDVGAIEALRGLAWRRPWLAMVLAAMLLSLAGIPVTAGFVGKFYLLTAGVASSLWVLVGTLVVASAIGLAYYLRVIATLLARREESSMTGDEASDAPLDTGIAGVGIAIPLAGSATLAAILLALVWLRVYPTPLIELIQTIVAGLSGS
jgi:NADH-quinone oxidoreductase subunit N